MSKRSTPKQINRRYHNSMKAITKGSYEQSILEALTNGKNTYLRVDRTESSSFDNTWIDVIEGVIFDLGEIVQNPRLFTRTEGAIVPVELARKTNAESVQHLASHTQYIKDIDEFGNVVPSKILTILHDDDIKTYENRFIATFIRRLVLFVEKRYEVVAKMAQLHDEEVLMVKNKSMIDGCEVEVETKVKISHPNEDAQSIKTNSYIARIEQMRNYILYFYNSQFMHQLRTEKDVHKPILQTNIIRKNPKYHHCYEVFKFIEGYSSMGVSYKVDEDYSVFNDEELKELNRTLFANYITLKGKDRSKESKGSSKVYKPRIITSEEDDKFVYGKHLAGPFEFVRADEQYREYLRSKLRDDLPKEPTEREKEFYKEEYAAKDELRQDEKELRDLIKRVNAENAKFQKEVERLEIERELARLALEKRQQEVVKAGEDTLLEEARDDIVNAALADEEERRRKEEEEFLGWLFWVIFLTLLLGLIAGAGFLLFLFLRKYIRFVKKELDKEELKRQVERLNYELYQAVQEKDKILNLKVGYMGLKTDELDQESQETIEEVSARFPKCIRVDNTYRGTDLDIAPIPDLTLEELCNSFRNFCASQLKLYYREDVIKQLFAGMATSKLIILEGISGTGKTSLAYALGKFFSFDSAIIPVQPSWKDRSELLGYYNEFTKKFNETEFLKSLYITTYRNDLNVIVLDELNLARIEYYFAEFLSVMEMRDPNDWLIDLIPAPLASDPANFNEGKLLIPQNVMFFGTANNDDSTFTISDKVYDRAISLFFDDKGRPFEYADQEAISMPYSQLRSLFDEAVGQYPISDEMRKKFEELDNFVIKKFKLAFGNRIMKQLDTFIPGNDILANKDSYAVIPFVFRVIRSNTTETNNYVEGSELWLTDAQVRASSSDDGNIYKAVRMFVDRGNDYEDDFVINPSSLSAGKTVVGGLLNIAKDSFYDYDENDNEIIYGDYEIVGGLTPSYSGADEIVDINGTGKSEIDTFTAKHRPGINYYNNYNNCILKSAEYESLNSIAPMKDEITGTLYNKDSNHPTSVCKTAGASDHYLGRVSFTVYLEGWDHSVIDEEIEHYFDLGLTFEINKLGA